MTRKRENKEMSENSNLGTEQKKEFFDEDFENEINTKDEGIIEFKEDIPKPKEKDKEEICKVLWVKPYKFAISFKGYGISIKDKIDPSMKQLKVKYKGEIGKPDFKIISYN